MGEFTGNTSTIPGADNGVARTFNDVMVVIDSTITGNTGGGIESAQGGLTLVYSTVPASTSPLLDRIAPADCQSGDAAGVTIDQRGIPRSRRSPSRPPSPADPSPADGAETRYRAWLGSAP